MNHSGILKHYCIQSKAMVELKIYQTKLFSVLDVRDDGKRLRKLTDYKVFGSGDNREVNKNVTASLTNHGCCVRANSIKPEVLQRTRKVLTSFAKTLISKYDELDDEFVDVDCNDMHIERMPRIGRGKHNIHFDPLLSKQHCAVADLARESCFSETLSMYMGKLCTLREAGISLTRPINDKITEDNQTCTDEDNNDTADIEIVTKGKAMTGEGMEWHSDGAAGEATVLMSVDDIDESMGSLRVVPGSHKRYVAGIGHDENILKSSLLSLSEEQVIYEYRAGEPMMIDARTLHSVSCNSSDRWRMIVWFIYDCY